MYFVIIIERLFFAVLELWLLGFFYTCF